MRVATPFSLPPTLVIIGLMGFLAGSGYPASMARAESAGRGDLVSVENGLLRVGLDRQDGNLSMLMDLAPEHNHLDDEANPGGLWELELLADGPSLKLKLPAREAWIIEFRQSRAISAVRETSSN